MVQIIAVVVLNITLVKYLWTTFHFLGGESSTIVLNGDASRFKENLGAASLGLSVLFIFSLVSLSLLLLLLLEDLALFKVSSVVIYLTRLCGTPFLPHKFH